MLKRLIRYTELADQLILEEFNKTSLSLPIAEELFSHVLNAQHIWISRILKIETRYDRFQKHEKEQFKSISAENISALNQILIDVNLDEVLPYTIATGDTFENTIGDILFHVVNHSTYHRAQIASQLKLAGITPPITDYVFLTRQDTF